ncbi:hypothetical protein B0J17DRAFT_767041 [Rhizoctonia solani]|nr:hypothetical protein B0J17DRAFT_767041 [Rhizoctonia solani]
MPALIVRQAASRTVSSSASQEEQSSEINSSQLIPLITPIRKREPSNELFSVIEVESGSSKDVGNQLDLRVLRMATSERSSVEVADRDPASARRMRMRFPSTGGVGANAAMAPSQMGETKRNDRRRPKEECFRSQGEAVYFAHEITLPFDGRRKSPSNDDRTGGRMTLLPRLPPPSLPIPTTSSISMSSSDSNARPVSLAGLSIALPSFRPTAPSPLAPLPSLTARGDVNATPTAVARSGFSAGTVIALSTVLPVIIILLLGVIGYLLRTRNRPRPEGSPKDQENEFPMVDIGGAEHSFGALEHRAVSPFDVSLHELAFGRSANNSKPETTSIRSHASSDSGHATSNVHADQPNVPPIAITQASDPDPPSTPVLAVRYPSKHMPGVSKPGDRTSIYVDRTSIDTGSGTASPVVFARPAAMDEEGSIGRPSREEPVSRLGLGTGRTSRDNFAQSGRVNQDNSPITAGPSSGRVSAAETLATGGDVGFGPKALKLLAIGPPTRAHARSQSQPTSTYSLPSLHITPRTRTGQVPGEVNARSPLGPAPVQESQQRVRPQRIYSHQVSTSLSTPINASSLLPSVPPLLPAPLPKDLDRNPLSIIVPPRLGAPIRPVAELAALQTPSTLPQQTPRINTPRTDGPQTPASPLSIHDALGLPRPRGMSDLAEPSPEIRERILRLLGRLPGEPVSSNPGSREGDGRRSGDVRRTRSEGKLHGQQHDET